MVNILMRIAKSMAPKTVLEVVVLCLVVGALSWFLIDHARDDWARRRGVADAHADIARGDFRYRLRGLARRWDRKASLIAQRDYGIQIQRTGGCVGCGPEFFYDLAYNRVVQDRFLQELGFDPIMRSRDQARREWEKERTDRTAEIEPVEDNKRLP